MADVSFTNNIQARLCHGAGLAACPAANRTDEERRTWTDLHSPVIQLELEQKKQKKNININKTYSGITLNLMFYRASQIEHMLSILACKKNETFIIL